MSRPGNISNLSCALVLALVASGCERQQGASDAEAIRNAAQGVLAANEKARAKSEREALHGDLEAVQGTLIAWQRTVGGAAIGAAGGTARSEGAARKATVDALAALRQRLETFAREDRAATDEWRATAYAASAERIGSMIAEVDAVSGMGAPEQLRVAGALAERLQVRHLAIGQRADDTPTMSALSQHR